MSTIEIAEINIFREQITANLINNINEHMCNTLANMLAIDYTIRLNSKPQVNEHLDNCIHKLKNYLGQKVITDPCFSNVLMLFAIAITIEKKHPTNHNNDYLAESQSEDIIVTTLVNMYFPYIDFANIQSILRTLLTYKNRNEILNNLYKEPELFYLIVTSALAKYPDSQKRNNYIRTEITKILPILTKFDKKTNLVKQLASKITTAACMLGVGLLSIITAGLTTTIIVLPASIFAVKYGPKLGETIGEKILNLDNSATLGQAQIQTLKSNLQQTTQGSFMQQQSEEHYQDKDIENIPNQNIDVILQKEYPIKFLNIVQKNTQNITSNVRKKSHKHSTKTPTTRYR